MITIETLCEVILENREEVMRHKVIGRNVSLDDFDRQVLVGVRRAGKSYMLYSRMQQLMAQGHTWNEMLYLNFEDERLAGMQREDLNKILEAFARLSDKRPMLFFDEIQNVEGWEKFARRMADNKYTVYITGSNAKMLSVDVAATLGGRYMTKEIFPMAFNEYLAINEKDPQLLAQTITTQLRGERMKLFEEYFQFGGFPECATLPVKRDYLTSLYQKIFLGDIAARYKVENIFALRILFKKLAESVNQPLSFTRATHIVASTGTKIGKSTIINYLNHAIDAYLILPIANIADKLSEKATNPKYYFIDNGLISLLAMDVRTALLENMVALKLFRTHGTKDAVFYYHREVELDFYVPETKTAIQVSYNTGQEETLARELKAFEKTKVHLATRRCLIVTYEQERIIQHNGLRVEVLPAWKFLME